MNDGAAASLLWGILVGAAATVTMDVLGMVSRKAGLAVGVKGHLVGRWYLSIAQGHFLHANIATAEGQSGEKRAALAGHYVIGIFLGMFYVIGLRAMGISPSSFVVAVVYGLGTCVFPWLLMFPALGFGVFGRKAPPELRLFTTSLLNHFFYGLGLWWISTLLRLRQ